MNSNPSIYIKEYFSSMSSLEGKDMPLDIISNTSDTFNAHYTTLNTHDNTLDTSSNTSNAFDIVEAPSHYCKNGIWCKDMIKAITANLTGYEAVCVGNITKYIWRFKGKNGVEDLKKARKYLDELIEYLEDQ